MGYSSMAICALVALVLARFIHGRPAIDESGLNLNMLESHGHSKLEDLPSYESNAISSSLESSSFSAKSRQKRQLSDQRLAELETLMSLSKTDPANFKSINSPFFKSKALIVQGDHSSSVLTKPREKRASDQRLAELETLISLSKITGRKRSLNMMAGNESTRQFNLEIIGRRRRFTMNEIPVESVAILKDDGDPAYPLVS